MSGIAVVGGGLGGLTLARVLQRHGLEVAVYEREASPQVRGQGGSLDIHLESGQFALREAGLEAEFWAAARPEDQEMRILDPSGRIWWEDAGIGEGHDRPEIDRGTLRTILLDSLRPGTVRWDHDLCRVERVRDGKYRLGFENGVSIEPDLVVGADGAWSRVRSVISSITPAYSGVMFVEFGLPDAEARTPDLARFVGHGKLFALGDGKGILAQRNGDGRIRVYAAFRVAQDWILGAGIRFNQADEVRQVMLDLFQDWDPRLTGLLAHSDEVVVARRLCALPVGFRWPSYPGVTLLGDAAHLMSPFAGEGANLAMQDGAELALALVRHPDLDEAVRGYEEAMFARAERAAAESAANLDLAISPEGARLLAERMARYMGDISGSAGDEASSR